MPGDQAAIDKESGQNRRDQPRQHQEQAGQHDEEKSKLHARQPSAQRPDQTSTVPPRLEIGTRLTR